MHNTSALFHILSQPVINRDETALVDQDPANDHSSIIRLHNLILAHIQ